MLDAIALGYVLSADKHTVLADQNYIFVVCYMPHKVKILPWIFFFPQIQKVILALGDYMGASCYACIGGTNIRNEVQKLQAEAPHIVVGTPGRVFDMLSRKNICKLTGLWIWVFRET